MTEAIKEEKVLLLEMVMDIGSPLEAWRAFIKIAADTQDAAYDRAKNEFDTLEIGANETLA